MGEKALGLMAEFSVLCACKRRFVNPCLKTTKPEQPRRDLYRINFLKEASFYVSQKVSNEKHLPLTCISDFETVHLNKTDGLTQL